MRLGRKVSLNSVKRDVDVFVRSYLPSEPDKRRPPEDMFDSPLAELGLIEEVERGLYSFNMGANMTLPDAVLSYALKSYWATSNLDAATLSFTEALHGPGQPWRSL